MLKKKYIEKIKLEISDFSKDKSVKFFIFGSSLRRKNFGDVDLGVCGNIKIGDIAALKERFVDSNIPYFIDVVNFNKTPKEFKNNVFSGKILWIKR